METDQGHYGNLPDGREVTQYLLKNANGVAIRVIDYGVTITSVQTPDRNGSLDEVTLGFDTMEGYTGRQPFFGATVGRCANRIAQGRFTLEGQTYSLVRNDGGKNHLHGGTAGFDKRMWSGAPFSRGSSAGVRFHYASPDGEESYPGRLEVNVTITLNEKNELELRYEATSDRPTICNLTNHTYWNLAGAHGGTILDHRVALHASSYLPVDASLIPTGEIAAVDGTPFDFRKEKTVSTDIEAAGGGYDHCYVIDRDDNSAVQVSDGQRLYPAARVYEPGSGRGLELFATQPGVQFYTGNMLTGVLGRGGARFAKHTGLCLETEAFPDAANHDNFPSVELRPGGKYDQIAKLYFFSK